MSECKKAPKRYFKVAVTHVDPKTNNTTEVIAPTDILALNEDNARTIVVRQVPDTYDEKLDELNIVVVPLA